MGLKSTIEFYYIRSHPGLRDCKNNYGLGRLVSVSACLEGPNSGILARRRWKPTISVGHCQKVDCIGGFIIFCIPFIQMIPVEHPLPPPSTQPLPKQKERDRQFKRYKYCCRKCKHTERGKKSCVCVVPLSQRRTSLTEVGCQTCKCKGCSIEDYIERGEDPEYKPIRSEKRQSVESEVNLCCKKCSSSKTHKRCVCQLPKNRRRNKLSSKGCKLCGCSGCNPKEESSGSSSSPSKNRSEQSSNENRVYNELEFNFNNIDRSLIGRVVAVEYNLNPSMIGLGIPQRTPSYILGKPL